MTLAERIAFIALFEKDTEDLVKELISPYYFLTGHTPYVSTAEAISTVGLNYTPYMLVNVDGIDHWFQPDGSLIPYVGSLSLTDKAVTLQKMADMATLSFIGRNTEGAGVPEILSVAVVKTMLGIIDSTALAVEFEKYVLKQADKSLVLNSLIALIHEDLPDDTKVDKVEDYRLISDLEVVKLEALEQNIFTLTLPDGDSVAARCAGATVADYPTGWTISAQSGSPKNLQINHGLGRRFVDVKIYSLDGLTTERLLYANASHSGLLALDQNTLIIEALATIEAPIVIHLIFA